MLPRKIHDFLTSVLTEIIKKWIDFSACAARYIKPQHIHLGRLTHLYKTEGTWPLKYIRDFKQKNNYDMTPLEWALYHPKKVDFSDKQWLYLLKHSCIKHTDNVNLLSMWLYESNIKKNPLSTDYILKNYDMRKVETNVRCLTILMEKGNFITSEQWSHILYKHDWRKYKNELFCQALKYLGACPTFLHEHWLFIAKPVNLEKINIDLNKSQSEQLSVVNSLVLHDKLSYQVEKKIHKKLNKI